MKALIVVLILICFNQRINSQVLVVEFDAHLRYNTGQVHEYEKVIDEKYHLETFSRFGILNKYVFDIDHMILYYYANNDLFSTLKINEAHLENNIWFVELDDFCLETKEKVKTTYAINYSVEENHKPYFAMFYKNVKTNTYDAYVAP
jgi:hypothetical protein